MFPAVRIRQSTWDRISAELDRVAPAEGLAVPLMALRPRRLDQHPCGALRLADLEAVLVAEAIRLPPGGQVNQPARVWVRKGGNQFVHRRIDTLSRNHPRLRACAYLHSHPFARGATRPSTGPGGDLPGHLRPLLEHNREGGLEVAFSLIACRTADRTGWRLQAFALETGDRLVDLGFARPLPDDSPVWRWALRGPLWARTPFVRLHRRFCLALARLGLRHTCDELFDGWLRTIVELSDGGRATLLTPLDYPLRPVQLWASAGPGQMSQPLPPLRAGLWPPERWAELLAWTSGRRHGLA